MTSFSRRTFVGGVVATPFALWLSRNASAQTLRVRHDAASPEGLAMLQIYADAVRLMKLRPDPDTLGWLWQWYTHFVTGTTTKSAEITRIFGTTTTTTSTLANEVWNTCQSHAGQNANHFLPWHRMFVYFFEQIVRRVTGQSQFTLPYWNYTSTDPTKRGVLPLQFRLPNDPVFAPLYRADRTSLANSGQPIQMNQPGDAMEIATPMAKQNYMTVSSVPGFCRTLDSGVHGRIHVLVGTSRNMGAVPYAAQDPLFWVHHSNIDRLWASWNLNGGLNPTDSWTNTRFAFAGPSGARVSGTLRQFFSTETLGYTYDRFVLPDGTEPATATSFTAQARAMMALERIGTVSERIAQAPSAELSEKPVRVTFTSLTGKPVNSLDPTRSRRTYLVIRELHTWAQPEVLYHLYLAPRGAGGVSENSYVGNINFFDAEFHDHGQGAKGDVLGENFYAFDVTDVLRRWLESGAFAQRGGPLVLTIVPGGRPAANARPLVGSIELVWQ